jgi:hypothetical protein
MSTMTLRKRIALTAIGALTAGLLTVVATPSANASTGNAITQNGASTGIISPLGTGSTVTMAADGILQLNIATPTGAISVSGGKVIGLTSNDAVAGSQPTIIADGSGIQALGINGAYAATGLQFKPNAAGTTMTIKEYGTAAANTAYTGTLAAAQALEAAGTTGVLKRTITVTVVSAGASGTYSAGNSFISIQAIGSATATVADAPFENRAAGSNQIRINYNLLDALGVAMPASTSVQAQVTSGSCVVSSTTTTGTLPVVAENAASGDFFISNATDPLVATNCNVDISVGGVVRSTKALVFHGNPAKFTVSAPAIGRTNNTSSNLGAVTGKGTVVVTDAAGNTLGGISVSADTTTLSGVVSTFAITNSGFTSSRASDTLPATRRNASAGSTPSFLEFTCTSLGGSSTVKLFTTLGNGTRVTSDPIPVSCAGGANEYTASLDKASYVPGDIAVLSISAKDSSSAKRAVSDDTTLGGGTTASGPQISGSNMTAVTAPSNGDTFTSGTKTYRFVVGATTGSYNMVVDLPSINATSTVGQTAVTLAYKIASSSTEVSNAEVLKSIVALIASINKQIQALQKLILARR